MSSLRRLALVGAVASCASALAAAEWSTYTNAEVVAVDLIGRTLVIRNAKGVEEKVELDDNLAGFGDIKAGDRVILTLRTGPGWTRVSSIVKSGAVPAPKVAPRPLPGQPVAPADNSPSLASREAFGARVARLAGRPTGSITFGTSSGKPAISRRRIRARARGFVIWEGAIRADLSGGFCRDLFNQIIDLGEPIKAGMTAAEDVARRTFSPGDIREIRRQYTLDWDGWGLAPPKQLKQ
jgi:hypothetical protein